MAWGFYHAGVFIASFGNFFSGSVALIAFVVSALAMFVTVVDAWFVTVRNDVPRHPVEPTEKVPQAPYEPSFS